MKRPLAALLGTLAVFAAVAIGVLGYVLPSGTAPRVETSAPLERALTKRLLLVVVDGLRYDVATDPARMPHFAEAMRKHASGELWAGRVSMTTSAILTFVTGERGSFEQIVFNADPSPPPFDSWLAHAEQRGLSVMQVGDPAWTRMFGASIDEHRLDPEGVSIDVDFNPQTFRDARELRSKDPSVLIVHFVTPDHQAHAYTIPSKRFAQHIRGFDEDLHRFLGELSPSWTVFVAGDHGAADSGTHGADVPIQRRTALYAYGPGVVRSVPGKQSVDQADLAGTFATLLGLPLPAHSRGHVLVEWLDVSPEARSLIACANAERAVRLARSRELDPPSVECSDLASARSTVAKVDAAVEANTGLSATIVVPLIAVVVLVGLGTVLAALGLGAWKGALAALALGAFSVLCTWGIERLPGQTPLYVRVAMFGLGNALALACLVAPARIASWLRRAPDFAPLVLPGLLVATYTTNAQPESYVAIVVGAVLFVAIGGLSAWKLQRVVHPLELALVGIALAALFLPGTRWSEIAPSFMLRQGTASVVAGSVLLAAAALVFGARAEDRRRWPIVLVGAACIVGAFLLRRWVPPWPGRLAIVVGIAAAGFFALRGRPLPGLLAGLFAYAWISRDFEVFAMVATLVVARVAGAAVARHGAALDLPNVLLAAAFLFGLAFVQRIGLTGQLDFGAMDWGAAGFGDPHVPAWIVGTALGLKYAIGVTLVLGAFVADFGVRDRTRVARAAFVAFLARGVLITAIFLVCGKSFWTGLRSLGDLPFGFLWAAAAALFWLGLAFSENR